MSVLGDNVKRLRKEKKWSLVVLSNKTGIPVSTLNGIEKGSRPSYDKIIKLSDVFNVPLEELTDNIPGLYILPKVDTDSIPGLNEILNKKNNSVEEFKNMASSDTSMKEKENILELIEYYNKIYCNEKYDITKITDDDIQDLKTMIYISIKTTLKSYEK